MFIVSITFGILSGIIAAAAALLSGSGVITALIVYVVAGIAGMIATIIWNLIPKQTRTTKAVVTQRS
ncbi:MAG: hypothetical protein AAFP85_05685 [Pseudomonadota bacterium]